MKDSYIIALFMQDIWQDCIEPQERNVAFSVSKLVFLESGNVHEWLVFQIQSHIGLCVTHFLYKMLVNAYMPDRVILLV